jgi:hypothetical protein
MFVDNAGMDVRLQLERVLLALVLIALTGLFGGTNLIGKNALTKHQAQMFSINILPYFERHASHISLDQINDVSGVVYGGVVELWPISHADNYRNCQYDSRCVLVAAFYVLPWDSYFIFLRKRVVLTTLASICIF